MGERVDEGTGCVFCDIGVDPPPAGYAPSRHGPWMHWSSRAERYLPCTNEMFRAQIIAAKLSERSRNMKAMG